jgi:hypothetical protein
MGLQVVKNFIAGTPLTEGAKHVDVTFFGLTRTVQSAYKVLSDGVANSGCGKFLIVGVMTSFIIHAN